MSPTPYDEEDAIKLIEERISFRDRLLGEFPKPLEIKNFNGACPARDHDKSHRMRWEGDHHAVCRDCGGVYIG